MKEIADKRWARSAKVGKVGRFIRAVSDRVPRIHAELDVNDPNYEAFMEWINDTTDTYGIEKITFLQNIAAETETFNPVESDAFDQDIALALGVAKEGHALVKVLEERRKQLVSAV